MDLKKTGKVFTSKFAETGPSSYKKRIYRAAVPQRLRNTDVEWSRYSWPIPVAIRSKAWVYGRFITGIAGSNSAEGIDISFVFAVGCESSGLLLGCVI